jgi:nucleotide-binding universal stress UspA family protein
MKTILIPTDFSETSSNAARYAVDLADQLTVEKIILYNVYQAGVNVIADPMIPALGALDLDNIKTASEEGLENFKNELLDYAYKKIDIETISEFTLLTEGIDNLCSKYEIDLIIMGITGGGAIQENFFGSNTINVARHTTVPVIIVPPDAIFKKIDNIIFACDFNKVVESTPVNAMKKILDATQAKLYILHVDDYNKENKTDIKFESLMLDTLLEGYEKEYHFADSPDFTEGINDFAEEKEIDLIITIPKKHGLFDNLFKRSHTKMLAFHSHVPLMVIHE